jgi:outer membrane murein-binding lipoprotein Lpp
MPKGGATLTGHREPARGNVPDYVHRKITRSTCNSIKLFRANLEVVATNPTIDRTYHDNLSKGFLNLAKAVAELQKDLDAMRRERQQASRK